MNVSQHAATANALAAWYAVSARDLPWRRAGTAYAVLLSEFMCQQTRVETAVAFYDRFMARWPDIDALARASDEDVLQAWSGLGYYRRARNLVKCVRACVRAGGIPDNADALATLPGVGPYTAGAIASIAFGQAVPAIDGNVERVASRLMALAEDPKRKGRKPIQRMIQGILDARGDVPAGDLNQALMELGATHCSPRRPDCSRCPVSFACEGHQTQTATRWPVRTAARPPQRVRAVYGLLRRGNTVCMGKRKEGGFLAGMWEPIGVPIEASAEPVAALSEAFELACGLLVEVRKRRGSVTHVLTHRRLELEVFDVSLAGPGALCVGALYDEVRWVADIDALPQSALSRKVLALAGM